MFENLRAALAHDTSADPQARDERPSWAVSDSITTSPPDTGDIEDWIEEYKRNPLIHKPIGQFASDVAEPGYRVDLADTDDPDEPVEAPEVPEGTYSGEPLDTALEQWLGESAIIAGEFHRDFGDLIEDTIKDSRGKRGTALVEHVYDDREKQDQLLALRLFPTETVTAYTRPGQAILLRPDDDPSDLGTPDVTAVRSLSGDVNAVPTTAAGDTAAYVQFDSVIGHEADEVALSQNDVTKIANNPDSGAIFGEPDVAQVYDRAHGIRQQFADLDTGLKGKLFGYWIAQVGTEDQPVDEATAKELVADLALNDPASKTAVPYQVEPKKFDGEVPDVENVLQYQIEYVLAAMPTPLYRVGFAGDINRDITGEQREDYRDEVKRWRRRLESAFSDVIQQKADELMGGDAPEVRLRIEPEQDESPLRDEQFDATQFKEFAQGLKAVAPGGAPELVLPPETVVEKILKMDPEEVELDPLPEDDDTQPPGEGESEGDEEDAPPEEDLPDDADAEAAAAFADYLHATAGTDD